MKDTNTYGYVIVAKLPEDTPSKTPQGCSPVDEARTEINASIQESSDAWGTPIYNLLRYLSKAFS